MIRIISYIIITFFSIAISIAQVKSEEILIKNDSIVLPGTLTYSKEKTPLIIWVHGSGNVDRNGNQKPMVKANYIKQFRDSINKKEIAFYSFDKRTATKENYRFSKDATFIDLITDVKIVINHFKNDKRFSEIILAGHSQGSLIAMLASENTDKFISIAGPSDSVDKAILKQIHKSAPFLDSITKAHFKELKATGKVEKVNPMLQSVFAKQNQKFLKSWMDFNPSEEIKKLNIPILLLQGDADLQVEMADATNLLIANPKAKLVAIGGMNHVLKLVNSMSENQSSYMKPDFPLSSKLIKTIVSFVKK